jgi:hypothetical protein
MQIKHLAIVVVAFLAGLLAVSANAADLVPHRAVYDMRLGSARHNSGIIDIRGSMIMETSESCDGWETTQRIKLRFSHNDAEETESDSTFASYESRDGLNYRFNTRNLQDGELDEEFSGLAALESTNGKGKAVFSEPQQQEFALPPGTIFPTMHLIKLIERAQSGETIMAFTVFDGSRLEGAFEVNAVVTGTQPKAQVAIDSPLLKNQKMWVMRLAFFSSKKNVADPEYEIAVELQANGITRAITMDYGDFTVIGELRDIQPLPRAKCK